MPNIAVVVSLILMACSAKAQAVDEIIEPPPVMQAGIKNMPQVRRSYPDNMEELESLIGSLRKNGYANDYYIMGMMYVDGRLPKERLDHDTSRLYFEKAVAAYSCHADALLRLGVIYMAGRGSAEVDIRKGISLLEKSAECGSEKAYSNLGIIYIKGIKGINGVKKDHARARKYYEKSAHLGNAEAMSLLERWEYFVEVMSEQD